MNRMIAVIAVLLAAGALFLWLAGSGGNEESGNGEPGDMPAEKTSKTQNGGGNGAPWSGPKFFRFPVETNPPTLDPVKITDVTSHSVAGKLFNTLLRYDAKMQLIPDLAEALPEWDAGESSYTFKLRQDVVFHNGRAMTAADVKFSMERLLDPAESKRMQILEIVKGAKAKIEGKGAVSETPGLVAVDEHTFKFVLERPDPTFLHSLIMVNAAVIPREAVDEAARKGSTFSQQPVGTGPFAFKSWQANTRIEFVRHERYFKGRPHLEGIVFEIVTSPQMRLDRFLKGEFEVSEIPFGQYKALEAKHPEYLSRNPTFRTNYLGIGMHHSKEGGGFKPAEPLGTNPKLRQAINHAIDRRNICETILEGRSTPAQSIVPPGMLAYDKSLVSWTHDPAKSKALLAEAGFPEGQGLRPLGLLYRNDPDIRKVVVALQADLAAVGIKVDLQALDWAAFLDRLDGNPPDLFYLGWVADYNDPDNFLYWLFNTKQWGDPGNHSRYSNPEVDRLLDEAHASMDEAKRVELYREAERRIVADAPWCLLEFRINCILMQPYVKGAREQLGCLDVGAGLGSVEFSRVDFGR
ncbi:MAG: ABC transporter substrate-binding protein [Planctomycetota bacterium]|nr:ABC transporter substrate-binding protein [Planctomycetota bacterium]